MDANPPRRPNRRERRKMEKLSRNATPDEILPGTHRPPFAKDHMSAVLDALKEGLPGYEFAVFMFEKTAAPGQELPRFNYGSTCDRADMVNVLNAFVKKNEHLLHKLDELERDDRAEGSA